MLMKTLKIFLLTFVTATLVTSCTVIHNDSVVENSISLEEVLGSYDLWYVDYHKTTGTGDVKFISRAFTLSFVRGTLYANNNIVDIGKTGNGLGIPVGTYNTRTGTLEANHRLDGYYNFDVVQLSNDQIRIDFNNVSYYLEGYQVGNFDYDKLFYENIEYFLQEYVAWERVTAVNGTANTFDNENFLQFTPENNTTFYASKDAFGTDVGQLQWDFVGNYKVYDVNGHQNLKVLTLNYDGGATENFELSVVNDGKIELYHPSSQTTYAFLGRGFVQYLKGGKATKQTVRNSGRKRTKIIREKIDRK